MYLVMKEPKKLGFFAVFFPFYFNCKLKKFNSVFFKQKYVVEYFFNKLHTNSKEVTYYAHV